MEDTLTKEVKFCPTIPLPFYEFEAGNLAFRLPLTPGKREARTHSSLITAESSDKASQFRGLAFQCLLHPQREEGGRVLSDHAEKGLSKSGERAEFTVCPLQDLEVFVLFGAERGFLHIPPKWCT